jgi:hypothetical protein
MMNFIETRYDMINYLAIKYLEEAGAIDPAETLIKITEEILHERIKQSELKYQDFNDEL